MQALRFTAIVINRLLALCGVENSRERRFMQDFQLGNLRCMHAARFGDGALLRLRDLSLDYTAVSISPTQALHGEFHGTLGLVVVCAHSMSVPDGDMKCGFGIWDRDSSFWDEFEIQEI